MLETVSMIGERSADVLKLESLVRQLGEEQVAESLGVDEDSLLSLIAGDVFLDEDTASNLERLCEALGDSFELMEEGEAESLGGVSRTVAADDDDEVLDDYDGLAVDGAGEPVLALPPRGELTLAECREQKRQALWDARNLAVMTQFHLGLSYLEQLEMFTLVLEIELTLIMAYGETMPDPGLSWDAERRYHEQQLRLSRLRWVNRQRDECFSGAKGLIMRILGKKRRLSGKELYQQMIEYADEMLDVASAGEVPATLMDRVDGYIGQDSRILRGAAVR